jgi:hypothetical protein
LTYTEDDEIIPQGKLGDGQQLIISWDYNFDYPRRPDSFNQIYSYDDVHGLVALTQYTSHHILVGYPSPNGKYLYIKNNGAINGDLFTVEKPGRIRHLNFYGISNAYWAPDSVHFACSMHIYDVLTGSYWPIPDWRISSYVWTNDGNLLLVAGNFNEPRHLIRLKNTGEMLADLGEAPYLYGWFHLIAPSGTHVSFLNGEDGFLYIANLDGTQIRQVGDPDPDSARWWSPDGRHLAFVEFREKTSGGSLLETNKVLVLVDIEGGRRELLRLNETDLSGEISTDVAWSPDSSQFVVSSYIELDDGGAGSALFAMNVDGSNLRQIHEPHGLIHDVQWRRLPE